MSQEIPSPNEVDALLERLSDPEFKIKTSEEKQQIVDRLQYALKAGVCTISQHLAYTILIASADPSNARRHAANALNIAKKIESVGRETKRDLLIHADAAWINYEPQEIREHSALQVARKVVASPEDFDVITQQFARKIICIVGDDEEILSVIHSVNLKAKADLLYRAADKLPPEKILPELDAFLEELGDEKFRIGSGFLSGFLQKKIRITSDYAKDLIWALESKMDDEGAIPFELEDYAEEMHLKIEQFEEKMRADLQELRGVPDSEYFIALAYVSIADYVGYAGGHDEAQNYKDLALEIAKHIKNPGLIQYIEESQKDLDEYKEDDGEPDEE